MTLFLAALLLLVAQPTERECAWFARVVHDAIVTHQQEQLARERYHVEWGRHIDPELKARLDSLVDRAFLTDTPEAAADLLREASGVCSAEEA